MTNIKFETFQVFQVFEDIEELEDATNYLILSPISKPLPNNDLMYNSEKLEAWIRENCNFDKLIDFVFNNSVIQPNDKENIEKAYINLIDDFVETMKWKRDNPEPHSESNDSSEPSNESDITFEEVASGVGESEEVNIE